MALENFTDYRNNAKIKNNVESTNGKQTSFTYRPSRKESPLRRQIWDRFNAMKRDPLRLEAEKQWDLGMKMYRMWAPERDQRDWRADIVLPDGFSAVQSYLQETIVNRHRPVIRGVQQNDSPLEQFMSSIFNFALDTTEFDQETHKARTTSAICGTAFTLEEYRYETREVQDPTSYEDGELKYKKKTIVDFDDVYTRYVDNNSAFFDPGAEDQKYGQDCAYREVISHESFKSLYEGKPGYKNTEEVVCAGDVPSNVGYFKLAEDIDADEVELIHYWNKLTDTYGVLCNNVVIRDTPLPSKHKELPLDVWSFYPVPGQIYGMGIPFIIHTLVEERRSIRNMSLDRQKMHISKMFIVNDLFDISEEDLTPRPHGLIKLNTNGLPLNNAVLPLEYGDVPGSSLRIDESLKEDERRAHGMDDRPALQQGGTATEAAIVKEAAQQRIVLVNTLSNWNTLIRIGRKKLSNIQFYYGAKRMEKVHEGGKLADKKTYRTIRVDGFEYKIKGNPAKGEEVVLDTYKIPGWSSFQLDPTFSRYMQRNFDVIMDAESVPMVSQAIKRAQVNEMFGAIAGNPLFARFLDLDKSLTRYVQVNGESPKDWLASGGMSTDQQRMHAEEENMIFMEMERSGRIFALPGTPNATEAHNEVHLDFTQTKAFESLSEPVKKVVMLHIQDEIAKNPALAAAAQGGAGGQPGQPGGPAIDPATGAAATVAGGDVTQGNPVMPVA